ncbi:hypothetical protein OIN60_01760 [Paenibacillus sp. P96]|uniref:Uncharacterized protein n=1 Tax=Paenibacillus zeirhizosphaerae TaxID=2987519 RepID=A0ABT9FLA4_9BACL|nr:hypothetical protein [Paenibacillus sp. P96]MDP4095519.1 hypothetical protein [Paenibacillus sp. P96]
MNPIISTARLWTVMLLSIIMLFSFPAPFVDEDRGSAAGADSLAEAFNLSHPKETYQKPAIRAHFPILVKMVAVSNTIPVFSLPSVLIISSYPRPSLLFLPIIYIIYKRLYLKPIKFTSRFVVYYA